MNHYILTGKREAGKTRFCQILFRAAVARKMTVAGILTLTQREEDLRAVDLYTEESRRLAIFNRTSFSVEAPGDDKTSRTKQWTFDASTLSWGNQRIRKAPSSNLFILDEAGILEFERDQGWTAGMARMDSQTDHCSVVVVRPELINQARKRWSNSEILYIEEQKNLREEEFISQILGTC
ncbi:nucleoside-triphosphatase [Oceanispirochaeta sp.]|uniref:nucleoside-triphosphatase n=1 Tax=Oceanispirochaeta sp. TaxID=2035350 RepID=UPI00262631C3|nr:nucleoside-triphosphatase [Oceanispirochaeta sp.]MDA3958274.1 hypothetical protein [Oceanispirochaeta sp.]